MIHYNQAYHYDHHQPLSTTNVPVGRGFGQDVVGQTLTTEGLMIMMVCLAWSAEAKLSAGRAPRRR